MCPEQENNKTNQLAESQLQGSELNDYNPTEANISDTSKSSDYDIVGVPVSEQQKTSVLDQKSNEPSGKKKSPFMDILAPGLILMAITTVIALMLSVLNFTTKDVISEQLAAKKMEAVSSVFGKDIDPVLTPFEGKVTDPVREINLVTKNGKVLGFSVSVAPKGYGGEIDMLVGINLDNTVKGVRIVEEGETAGVGTKVKDEAFLYQFMRLVFEIKSNENENSIDLISGATISSKAVLRGVNAALERTLAIDIGAYVEPEADVIPSEQAQEVTQVATASAKTTEGMQSVEETQEAAQ